MEIVTHAGEGSYALDTVHSSIGFAIDRMGSKFRGWFEDCSATLVVTDGALLLTGTAKVASVRVREPALATHLRGPDFFDEERYPEITFVSRSILLKEQNAIHVLGDLTIRGITRAVEANGTAVYIEAGQLGLRHVGMNLEGVVDRHDFGLDWVMKLPNGKSALGDMVTITIETQFVGAVS